MAQVLWRDAQGKEGSIDLGGAEVLIGRAVECAIRTDDAMVSRKHARVYFDGAQYYVEDLGSANGIYYQEQRVSRHTLRHGDAVRCGSLWLRFIDQGRAAAGAPAPARPPAPTPGYHPQARPHRPTEPSPHLEMAPPEERTVDAPPSNQGASDEIRRLRRRIDQLQAELRLYRGGGQKANKLEELEAEVEQLGAERDQLAQRVEELEGTLAREGADVKVKRASSIAKTASEIVGELNDVLSNLRINVMAAEGEFEQFADAIPKASFELIREALRSSAADMESAREMLRKLREIARNS